MKKNMAGVLALLFMMVAALTGCAAGGGPDRTAEAMNVDGVSVPLGEVNLYLRYQQTQMQGFYGMYFGEDFMNQDLMGLGVPYGNTVRDTVVETLKEYYVVEAHAQELGITLTDEEKTNASEAAKAFLAANDSKALKAMTADEATVTHLLELMALQSKVYDDRAATIDTEVDPEAVAQKRISYVSSSIAPSVDEDGNETELTEAELTEKKEQLERILTAAKESGDLQAAAEAEEMSATSTTYGKDSTSLDEELVRAADALSDGEFSGVIETENNYYIVCMESTFDADATETAKQNELSQRERDAYDAWYSPLLEAAQITVNEELIQSLTFERVFSAPTEEPEEDVSAEGAEEPAAEESSEGAEESADDTAETPEGETE